MTELKRDDGYSLTRHIEESPQMYDALTFVCRPTSIRMSSDFMDKTRNMTEVGTANHAAKVIPTMILSWDYKDKDGNDVACTPQAFADPNFPPALFRKLRSIICYASEGGDPIPTDSGSVDPDDVDVLQKN
jgi:hypothetical protein